MARKKAGAANPNGVTEASTTARDNLTEKDSQDSGVVGIGAGSVSAPRLDVLGASAGVKRDVVKVNNASLTELKNACDDAVKAVCVPSYLCTIRVYSLSFSYLRALTLFLGSISWIISRYGATSSTSNSYYRIKTFLPRYTNIPTLSLLLGGQAYLSQLQPHYTDGKLSSRNQSH